MACSTAIRVKGTSRLAGIAPRQGSDGFSEMCEISEISEISRLGGLRAGSVEG
jgi:hypothetical protein